ncbi:MAG: hypothetical protein AVDCRST_MAG61-1205 [uncultured Friedmanniella sp.]|uniref:Uncharacterized protein n=1 Tax=uncultured Friedmanniella sp. TaxID=335381 RepID=A0A6J4KE51_9ACTN|nr:hypothetical protein [uncultured Friedmanniella sp.]CAA9303199.1 MAG: hypothetical protein AVDCRST_MAG61-1205 [uncultured Friedmanniella sp.]
MHIVEDALATVDNARAYQFEDIVFLQLSGTKPTGCHLVIIERGLPDVEPPAFLARLATDPRVRCTADSVPYEVQGAFRIGVAREQVLVHHADGPLEVAVEAIRGEEATLGPEGRSSSPVLIDPDQGPAEATGYSRSFDYGEALRDAIAKLPYRGGNLPDWLSTYSVVSVGAEIGGIGGFNHLVVRVAG